MSAYLLALCLTQYTPQEAQALFSEANDFAYREEYVAAQQRYEKLLQAGHGGADVLFNLGTSFLAAGQLGPAALYLERARRLSTDDDIEANLSIVKERQLDQVLGEAVAEPFAQRLATTIDERSFGLALLGCSWLGFGLAWFARQRAEGRRLIPGLLAAVTISGGILLAAALVVRHEVKTQIHEAVVMSEVASVREAPKETGKIAFEVHAGLIVRWLETSGRYARIRLPNALEGWTEASALTLIEP